MSVGKWDNLSRLETLLIFLNVTDKTKLAILGLLYCGEIVKNSIDVTRSESKQE